MSYSVFIHDAKTDRWIWGQDPVEIFEVHQLEAIIPALAAIERGVEAGLTAMGYVGYEAAPAFDSALVVQNPHQPAPGTLNADSLPLLWFGLYRHPQWLTTAELLQWADGPSTDGSVRGSYHLGPWTPTVDRQGFEQAIADIKAAIARGDTYQVNYTFRLRTSFQGNAWRLFTDLVQRRSGDYAAWLDLGRYALCSASPELFFTLEGDQIAARPMKGTHSRGLTLATDQAQAQALYQSPKNRAENLMIVDMIRNDLGRIAEVGSVAVPKLFETERYPTLWQMTSTVTAQTKAPWHQIMANLFPCASITGAPKARTMKLITALESSPRQIYTGTIGYLSTARKAQFNVAIRTVLVDRVAQTAEYGVGSGIVWDSVAAQEYEECRLKTQVLASLPPTFSLIETYRWTPQEGFFLRAYHLTRLMQSAAYFGFSVSSSALEDALDDLAKTLTPHPHRVKLQVNAQGQHILGAYPWSLPEATLPRQVRFAPTPIDTQNPFLYHKTTCRSVYETAQAAYADCDDVVLWNPAGDVTESCIANVVVPVKDKWLTPPIESGLLAGTFRAWLIDQGKLEIAPISKGLLAEIGQFYLINALRGWQSAVLKA
ncbi:MAG: aminodeoxychorismate synthase component I [Cyanobacteria bacterium J06635_15]